VQANSREESAKQSTHFLPKTEQLHMGTVSMHVTYLSWQRFNTKESFQDFNSAKT